MRSERLTRSFAERMVGELSEATRKLEAFIRDLQAKQRRVAKVPPAKPGIEPPGAGFKNAYFRFGPSYVELVSPTNEQGPVGRRVAASGDGVYLLADAYRKQKSTDPLQTIATLKKTHGWEGVMGTFNCDAEGNMIHQISIGEIENQKIKLVKKVSG